MSHFRLSQKQSRLFVFFVCVFIVIALVLTHTFNAKAEIAFFDALSIEQRVEEVDTDNMLQVHDYIWSSFTGVVPEGATVDGVMFTLSWIQSVDEEEDFNDSNNSEEQVDDSITSDAVSGESVLGKEENVVPVSEDIDSDVIEVEAPENIGTDLETLQHEDDVTGFPVVSKEVVYQLAQEEVREEVVETVEEVGVPSVEESLAPVSETSVSEVESQSEVVVPDAVIVPVIEVPAPHENEEQGSTEDTEAYEVLTEISTPSDVVSEGVTYHEEVPDEEYVSYVPTLETADVSYSFDGIEWFPIQTVNLLTSNEVTFDMSSISLETIPSLRIRLIYHAPIGGTHIIFQKPQLALSYTPGVVEEVSLIQSDQEPNFLVSSVYADVMDGTTRVVLLERGGIFELWLYATERETGLPFWNRLMSSGVSSQDIPISVKERTVFWFDPQIQVLNVFGIDEKSLKIVQPQSPQDSLITVPITKSNKSWIVTFDTTSYTFSFTRTPNISI